MQIVAFKQCKASKLWN